MPRLARLAVILGLAGCASNVRDLYEQSRAEAFAEAFPEGAPLPATWAPDAVLGVSWRLLDTVFSQEIAGRLARGRTWVEVPLPVGPSLRLMPELDLQGSRLAPSSACDGCAALSCDVSGDVAFTIGQISGRVPASLVVEAEVALSAREDGDRVVVEADLRDAEAGVARTLLLPRLSLPLDHPLVAWAMGLLEADVPAIEVARFGGSTLPVRALRIHTTPDRLVVDVLTRSPVRGGSPILGDDVRDWAVAIDEVALEGLLRRAGFDQGPLDYDVTADVRGFDAEGGTFTLDLRLWRLAGRPWWKDYRVEGTLRIDGDRVRLQPTGSLRTGGSPRAGLADPIAVLASGRFLQRIEEAVTWVAPTTARTALEGSELVLSLARVEGQGGTLVVSGDGWSRRRGPGE